MLIENYTDSEITHEEFLNIINKPEKIIVVNFFAEWCMNCLMFTPIIDDLAEQMQEINFIKINIEDNKDIANKFGVSKIPCVIIFKEGVELDRLKGTMSQETIEDKIRNCVKGILS
jgi:thioredoxin 1